MKYQFNQHGRTIFNESLIPDYSRHRKFFDEHPSFEFYLKGSDREQNVFLNCVKSNESSFGSLKNIIHVAEEISVKWLS